MSEKIKEIFSEVPRTYELVNHVLSLGLDIYWRKRLARHAASFTPRLCLDICSGTGETAVLLKRSCNGTTVVAADFSFPMLSVAMKKPTTGGILFTLANAHSLPFPDATFDIVTISFATRNLNTSRGALINYFREFLRVLKPGGSFINLETSQPKNAVIRWLFQRYVKTFVAPIGRLISGTGAGYKYLSNTIPRFYPAPELAQLFRDAGFSSVDVQSPFLGAAAIHTAIK